MSEIEVSINLLTLIGIIVAAGLIGYAFRSRQIRKKQFKIVELRKEIVNNHAHILELQKEYVVMESKLKVTTPVLPIKKEYLEEGQKISEKAI